MTVDRNHIMTAPALKGGRGMSLRFTDVTGMHEGEATVQEQTPVGQVARAMANRFQFPENTAYALRTDRGAILDEERTIGDQVSSEDQLTLTPKTHLG